MNRWAMFSLSLLIVYAIDVVSTLLLPEFFSGPPDVTRNLLLALGAVWLIEGDRKP